MSRGQIPRPPEPAIGQIMDQLAAEVNAAGTALIQGARPLVNQILAIGRMFTGKASE